VAAYPAWGAESGSLGAFGGNPGGNPSFLALPDESQEEVLETPVPTPRPFSADEREIGEATDPAVVVSGQRRERTP
jgi:hypothetical protein